MVFLPVIYIYIFGNNCGFRSPIKYSSILKLKDENQHNELATSLKFW